jgi:Ca2+-binding EF-hand superfamily protein
MSSVSACGGYSAAMYSGMQGSRTTEAQRSQQLFQKLDVNGDNGIDASELKSLVEFIGQKTGTTSDAGALLTALDSDGNGNISSTELDDNVQTLFDQLRGQLMGAKVESGQKSPDPEQLFGKIDTDGDGRLSLSELKSFAAERAGGRGPGAEDILARDDTDKDGSISKDEFNAAVQRAPKGPPATRGAEDPTRMLLSMLKQYGAEGSDSSMAASLQVAA